LVFDIGEESSKLSYFESGDFQLYKKFGFCGKEITEKLKIHQLFYGNIIDEENLRIIKEKFCFLS
jgi:hypothetical protein